MSEIDRAIGAIYSTTGLFVLLLLASYIVGRVL